MFEIYLLFYFSDVNKYGFINIHSELFTQIVARCIDDFELQMMNVKVN